MGDRVAELVALFSEHAIEAELIRMVAQGDPDSAAMIEVHKAALREIDRQKVAGTYPTGTPDASGMEAARGRDRAFLNYCAGLKSSAPDQRQRFSDVAARIGGWSYQEAAPFLAALEPAKGHKGRPAVASP